MTIQIGQKLPAARLFVTTDEGAEEVIADQYLSEGKVALFALPGAFTPTCSALHLPGFLARVEDFKARGIWRIACLSVNHRFVMAAWAEQQKVQGRIQMLADGNAELTVALGLEVDKSKSGMGIRSQRYSMLLDEGTVVALNVEAPGKFEVSDADTLLGQL